jgi:hypothetical protein
MNIELKKVKIAQNMSEETIAFTGELWIDNVKAADLKNDGQGGANFMWFKDRELEKAFNAYCKSLPSESVTDDWAIERGFKTMCVILKSHKQGQFSQYKAWPYSAAAAAEVRKIHGEELVEIINERFL